MDKAIKEIIKKYTQYQDAITEDTLLSVLEIHKNVKAGDITTKI